MFLLGQEPHPAEDKYGLLKTAVRPRRLAYLKSQSIRPGDSRYKGADADDTLKNSTNPALSFPKNIRRRITKHSHIH
jgi:hypothetical protein